MFDFFYKCEKMVAPDRDWTDEASKASPGNHAHIQQATAANNLLLSRLAQHCPSATCSRFVLESLICNSSLSPVTQCIRELLEWRNAPHDEYNVGDEQTYESVFPRWLRWTGWLYWLKPSQRLQCWWMPSPSTDRWWVDTRRTRMQAELIKRNDTDHLQCKETYYGTWKVMQTAGQSLSTVSAWQKLLHSSSTDQWKLGWNKTNSIRRCQRKHWGGTMVSNGKTMVFEYLL